jgi:dTDP-6-deoxy-L-talose 4-dehydrogenase (NAD+)
LNPLVLVTGGAGFVGRQVLRSLASKGVSIRLVLREGRGPVTEAAHAVESAVTTRDLFAEDAQWWQRACAGVDTVVHLAWYVEPGKYLGSPLNLDSLLGTLQLAKGAIAAGVRRFVGVGTCFEYDLTRGDLSTRTPLDPLTPYAAAKAAAFMALSRCLPAANVEFAWARLFYLYGEGEDARRLVPYIRSQLARGEPADLTQGDQVRDFMDVQDAARVICDAALSDAQGALNVCSGIPVTVRELAERIAGEYGKPGLLRFGTRANNETDPPRIVGIPGQTSPLDKQDAT